MSNVASRGILGLERIASTVSKAGANGPTSLLFERGST